MGKFDPIPEKVFFKRIIIALSLLTGLILMGTLVLLPKTNNFSDAFTKSASQVTRIPFSGENALLFFILALFGYVLAFYIIYVSIEFALEGKLKNIFLGARMEKKLHKLKNHCIVCGYGRVGKNVAEKLAKAGKQVVVIEKDENIVKNLKEKGVIAIEGSIEEEDLEKAGIKNAKHLITCTGDDGRNLLIIMAAKEMNPQVIISSRASDEKIIKKMRYAGANHIVMPEFLGGLRIVDSILKSDQNKEEGLYRSH